MSRAWLFLGCSLWLSLLMAANFLLFFRVAFCEDKKINFNTVQDWTNIFHCLLWSGEKIKMLFCKLRRTVCQRQYIPLKEFFSVFSFLLFIPFLWRKKLFTRQIISQIGNIQVKMPTLAGNKHLSLHSFPHRTRLFLLSAENGWT